MLFRRRRKTQKNPVAEYPTQLYLELSTFCNLACRTCVRNAVIDFQPAHFTPALLERLLPSIAELRTLQRIVLLGYGEALCNPHIHDILTRLGQTGIPLCLVTNGQLITADFVGLLLDLPVQEVFLSWDDYDDTDRIRVGSDTDKLRTVIEDLRGRRRGRFPLIGLEIVALRRNRDVLHKIVAASTAAGGEKIIVTNVFPYAEAMRDEILFTYQTKPIFDIQARLNGHGRHLPMTVANQIIGDHRACPFIEKGTLFVTAEGEVSPCMELAHSHTAWYFDARRTHFQLSFGNIMHQSLTEIWPTFADFREQFIYYDFPDCRRCTSTDLCRHRDSRDGDCFRNGSPCGECLWARGVIRCP